MRKILIVDDKVSVAKELAERLTKLGYEVTAIAPSPAEAANRGAQVKPDLVLMELALSDDVKSVEAVNRLQRSVAAPVVLMLAPSHEEVVQRAGVTEFHRYLVTPFTDRELRLSLELAFCKHDATTAVDELEERFFANSIDMLCMLDFSGYFKRLNPAWERTLGYTRQELMSRPFIEFVHPDDRERTLQQNAQVRDGGHALAFENRYLCKDGSFRWFRWNATSDSPHRVIYSVARDMTASKQAEEDREQLVRELQTALAEVNTLREILPICSYCRKIRDDENYWHTVEDYISEHTATMFSHGICPSCMETRVESQL